MTKHLRIYSNYAYPCFMLLPNINLWYEDQSLFFGWLFWGFNIELYEKDKTKEL